MENRGYITFQEIKYRYGEIDIVGVQLFKTVPPRLTTIEVKMNNWDSVLGQARRRILSFADYSYIGLIYKNVGDLRYFFYKFGQDFDRLTTQPYQIGILIYDVKRNYVLQVLRAMKEQQYKDPMKDEILKKVGYNLESRKN